MSTPVVWRVDQDFPEGHAVPMSAAEAAQHAADQAAAAAEAAKPVPPTLAQQFASVVDAVLNAADFDTAKAQIAAVTGRPKK